MNNSNIASHILTSTLEIASEGASRSFLLQNISGMNDRVADWAISALVRDQMLVALSNASGTHVAYKTTVKGFAYLHRKRSESVAHFLIMAA